jgi:AraC-like DNA-binding protein
VQLYDLRSLIYQDPQTPWSVEKMCQKVCLSRSYFQHLYKNFFSISFSNDLINARINFAKKLLVSTMLNINEISEKCGYANVEHFIRQFKKKKGVSPKHFRLMR